MGYYKSCWLPSFLYSLSTSFFSPVDWPTVLLCFKLDASMDIKLPFKPWFEPHEHCKYLCWDESVCIYSNLEKKLYYTGMMQDKVTSLLLQSWCLSLQLKMWFSGLCFFLHGFPPFSFFWSWILWSHEKLIRLQHYCFPNLTDLVWRKPLKLMMYLNFFKPVCGAGWGLHGTTSVASPMQRRLVIQHLLNGDLADLADGELHHLLPKLQRKPWAVKKLKNNPKQQHLGQVTEKHQKNKGVDTTINDDALCFINLEKNVSVWLSRHHPNTQMTQALRKAVFPDLNLKSYLNCRSDLDLQTIRHLLRSRPSDEANELDQALTKVSEGHKQRPMTQYQGSALTKLTGQTQAAGLKNSHNMVPTNHRLQPMEWED